MKKWVHGKVEKNSKYRGWITGSFYPEEVINHDKNIEIKVDYFDKSESFKKHFHLKRKSWTIIIEGTMYMLINGERITIKKGEYIIYKPGVTEELIKTDPNTIVVSIHTPSTKPDKVDV